MELNIHIFIDAENVPTAKAIEAYELMNKEHNVYRCDVVAKESTLSAAYRKRSSKKFRIQNCDFGKNSADLWLTVCIAKALYEEPHIELFVIFSNDRDFVPIIKFAVEKKKQVLLLVVYSQYRFINDYLTKMKIDRDFLTVGTLDEEPALEVITVNQLPPSLRVYYRKRYKGNTVFAMRGEKFVELPFINGMGLGKFTQLMRYYKIWGKSAKATNRIHELSLSIRDNCVWYQSEDEIMASVDDN